MQTGGWYVKGEVFIFRVIPPFSVIGVHFLGI